MNKLMMAVMVAGTAVAVNAMPMKDQMTKARPMVNELMTPKLEELKAGKIKDVDVGDAAVGFAAEAKGQATKYQFLAGSLFYYIRAKEYEKAVAVLDSIAVEIEGFGDEELVEVLPKSVGRIPAAEGGRLVAMYEQAKFRVGIRKELKALSKAAATGGADDKRRYADALAASGDWKKALTLYAKLPRDLSQQARNEMEKTAIALEAGDFWWNYQPFYAKAGDTFKIHAAEFYQAALDSGKIEGLKRNLLEQRIASLKEKAAAGVAGAVAGAKIGKAAPKLAPRTFDLGDGIALDMVACPAGSFTMGVKNAKPGQVPAHKVTITRPFLIAKFPVTREQFVRILKRKTIKLLLAIDDSRISEKLRVMTELNAMFRDQLPTGYVFRLPTEAELVYASTAGGKDVIDASATGKFGPTQAQKMEAMNKIGWKWNVIRAAPVGLCSPNRWGVCDLVGNGEPVVLDIVAPDSPMRAIKVGDRGVVTEVKYAAVESDPLCWAENLPGAKRFVLGQYDLNVRRIGGDRGYNDTFRIVLGPDLVTERSGK